jgi:hypothetical protein
MSDTQDPRRGTFLGVPYDWRRPSLERMRRSVWNPDDDRLFPPRSFGWGYGLNLHALGRRLTGGGRGTR